MDCLCLICEYIFVNIELVVDYFDGYIDVIVYCGIIISVELCNFYGVRMLSIYIMNYYMYKIYIQVEII